MFKKKKKMAEPLPFLFWDRFVVGVYECIKAVINVTLSSEIGNGNLLAYLSSGLMHTLALMQGAQRDGRVAAGADIEQLSRPQQQMSAYNCTRLRNNRNSVRYETTRRT